MGARSAQRISCTILACLTRDVGQGEAVEHGSCTTCVMPRLPMESQTQSRSRGCRAPAVQTPRDSINTCSALWVSRLLESTIIRPDSAMIHDTVLFCAT
eukprot:scaffold550933_cov18-Prasinocladus_malaysianus.AAC.1